MSENDYIKDIATQIMEKLIFHRLGENEDTEIGLMIFDDDIIDQLVEELENAEIYVSVYKFIRSVEIDERFQTGLIPEMEKVISIEDSETSERIRLIYQNDKKLSSQFIGYAEDVIIFNVPADVGAPNVVLKPDFSMGQLGKADNNNYITNTVNDNIFCN